jgi:hypothetical protein
MQLVSAAKNLIEPVGMTSVYNLLRETCGISQAEAAEFVHQARLDSVKSWCSDRRPAPAGVVRELKELAKKINAAGLAYAAQLMSLKTMQTVDVGIPHDDFDARHCGFPSLGASMRAISIAITELPDDVEIHIGPRVRGQRPINLIPDIVQAAFAIQKTARPRFTTGMKRDFGRESRALAVIDEFRIAGGNIHHLMHFYRDEFDHPADVGFDVLEKALLSPAPVTN